MIYLSETDSLASTAQNPTHTYTTAGSFTVSLTAANTLGATTRTNVYKNDNVIGRKKYTKKDFYGDLDIIFT